MLLLPGWQNSGSGHWQTLWEEQFGFERVMQHDWMRPLRGDWCARLDEVLLDQSSPVVLAAHSLGCQLVAAWAAYSRLTDRVAGALLVAAPDTEREDMRGLLPSWAPIAMQALPFPTIQVASTDDPYGALERAQAMSRAWGSQLHEIGGRGHINAESGLGDWEQGQAWLQELRLSHKGR